MTSATLQVLYTVELLEAIMVQVDEKTLLTSVLRVCRQWHDLATHSPLVQRALFMIPDGEYKEGTVRRKRQNPLFQYSFPAWLEDIVSIDPETRDCDEAQHIRNFELLATRGQHRFRETPLYEASLMSSDNPFLRPNASWRRMLISQPPCFSVAACTREMHEPIVENTGTVDMVFYPNGVRMGEFYDSFLSQCYMTPVSCFAVAWANGDEDEQYARLDERLEKFDVDHPSHRVIDQQLSYLFYRRPDLITMWIWANGDLQPETYPEKDSSLFWKRCGVDMLPEHMKTNPVRVIRPLGGH